MRDNVTSPDYNNSGPPNYMPVEGNWDRRSGSGFDGNGHRRSGSGCHRPAEGSWQCRAGSPINWPVDEDRDRRTGGHYPTHQRHHGKSQDYHHGWPGDGRIMQDGRFNNRNYPGEITHIITHDSGKSSDYRQLNG